jgi:site-specific recombinase XerD
MGVKIRVNKGKIFLDVYQKGTRKWEKTGLTVSKNTAQNREVMKLAEVLRSIRETQLVTGEKDLLDPVKSHSTLYFYMENQAKNAHTHNRTAQQALQYLEKFPGGKQIKLSEVSKSWVKNFKMYLLEETKLNPNTARNYLNAVKHALNLAVQENIIPKNPASKESIKPVESNGEFLNWDEVNLFAKVKASSEIEIGVKKAFLFACLTGVRVSDIKTLKWENLEHSSSGTKLVKRQKKTQTSIYNTIHNSAWEIAQDNQPHLPSDPVFLYMSQKIGNSEGILSRLAKHSGITKKVTWHVARRSFAIKMLENGVDLFTVSKLLGHSQITTTLKYLRMTSPLAQKAIEALPAINLPGSELTQPEPLTLQRTTYDPAKHTSQGLPA